MRSNNAISLHWIRGQAIALIPYVISAFFLLTLILKARSGFVVPVGWVLLLGEKWLPAITAVYWGSIVGEIGIIIGVWIHPYRKIIAGIGLGFTTGGIFISILVLGGLLNDCGCGLPGEAITVLIQKAIILLCFFVLFKQPYDISEDN
ncbi:MAG: hypothetical protein K9N46_14040 [Candidatus Marinimicrobia bacterium]|nr:hypothetical protein [Candidatus Neomarinimicrobiota bacterium]MCF7829997.1 hypothetical protein [Candidatus Neomarinimicrobiota bacterium]MCF7881849.1 hypothetical protein [Candidatus Neomarinimicrobiota bacterium]